MSVSVDGIICYGIFIGENHDLPWLNNKYDGCLEDWWIYEICGGYKDLIELHDENGEYINGVMPSKEDFDLYYHTRLEFRKEHPIPVEVVNTCRNGCVEYIIAVRGTVMYTTSRGYPETFNPENLKVTENQRYKLVNFCKNYLHTSEELIPKWYLASYLR